MRLVLLIACLLASCRFAGPTDEMYAKFGDGQTRILTDTDGAQYAVRHRIGANYEVRPLENRRQ